jgi:hypothetical protein
VNVLTNLTICAAKWSPDSDDAFETISFRLFSAARRRSRLFSAKDIKSALRGDFRLNKKVSDPTKPLGVKISVACSCRWVP